MHVSWSTPGSCLFPSLLVNSIKQRNWRYFELYGIPDNVWILQCFLKLLSWSECYSNQTVATFVIYSQSMGYGFPLVQRKSRALLSQAVALAWAELKICCFLRSRIVGQEAKIAVESEVLTAPSWDHGCLFGLRHIVIGFALCLQKYLCLSVRQWVFIQFRISGSLSR